MPKLNNSKTLSSVLSALMTLFCASPAFAGKVLDGEINQNATNGSGIGTGSRHNVGTVDPFAVSPGADSKQPANSAPIQRQTKSRPPKSPFDPEPQQDDAAPKMPSQQAPPHPQAAPHPQATPHPQPTPHPQAAPRSQSTRQPSALPSTMPTLYREDFDNSPEMKIAWKQWHQRVAKAIFVRFQHFADTQFRGSKALTAVAAYSVTRDGKIVNARLTAKNPDSRYNTLVLAAVTSLNGSPVLQFPNGSQRASVDKVGTFNHNDGSGVESFKFSGAGDKETIRQR